MSKSKENRGKSLKQRFKGRVRKIGMPPGTVLHHEDEASLEPVKISIVNYNKNDLEEKSTTEFSPVFFSKEATQKSWIEVVGIHNSSKIEKVSNYFNLHPLTIEDILNNEQRPKIEDNPDYIYLVVHMIRYDQEKLKVDIEQVSLVLGDDYVLSIQEKEGDTFEPVRKRLELDQEMIRQAGPDYLLYTLIDAIVDNYFLVIDQIGDTLDQLENELLDNLQRETFNNTHALKKELMTLRRSVWPMREVVSKMERGHYFKINEELNIYIRDLYDHTIEVIDSIEVYRETVGDLVNLYQSMSSNKMNEVMKVLTIISTIFIPLTFITGLYGMNFDYMPELQWRYGYHMVWGISITLVVIMLVVFRKKKWI
jgi:magnesium transporter